MRSLAGKVVVITGAASGIGRALALRAAGQAAILAVSDVDEDGLAETGRLCSERGAVRVRRDRLDVRDRAAVAEYAAAVRSDLGRVDVLVNNAGVALHGDLEEVDYEDFAWVMDVDFWGVVHGSKEFLPHLVESGGHLVNISSLFGLLAVPGQTAYSSAKFAVRGFTEALRQEMLVSGQPVRVTCVHPGGVSTAIARNMRATPSHDAAAVAEHFDTRLARTSADEAAAQIIDGVLAGKSRVVVGTDARLLDLLVRLAGARYQRLVAALHGRFGPQPARDRGRTNVRQ